LAQDFYFALGSSFHPITGVLTTSLHWPTCTSAIAIDAFVFPDGADANLSCSTTQFVLTAAEGCGSSCRKLMPAISTFGCISLSIHTRSKGMARTGYRFFEEIFEFELQRCLL
jgi:hypothetical protein